MKFTVDSVSDIKYYMEGNKLFTNNVVDTDDIRKMSDEELVTFIQEIAYSEYCFGNWEG